MKSVVVGSGGWGTALSMVLCDNGHDVTLWSHDPAKAAQMAAVRENSKLKGVRLPDSLKISGDLDCLKGAELVISATPSFAVRETGKKNCSLSDTGDRSGQCFQGHRAGYEPPHEPDFDGSHRKYL